MLYWMSYKSKPHPLTMAQLEHAIKRNFSGLESTNLNPLEEFQKAIGSMFGNQDLSAVTDDEVCSLLILLVKSHVLAFQGAEINS